jgi:hypothetical protein
VRPVVIGLTLAAALFLADCRRLQRQRYLEQTKRNTGETSLEACEDDAREVSTESVVVGDVSIDGSKALARATYLRLVEIDVAEGFISAPKLELLFLAAAKSCDASSG